MFFRLCFPSPLITSLFYIPWSYFWCPGFFPSFSARVVLLFWVLFFVFPPLFSLFFWSSLFFFAGFFFFQSLSFGPSLFAALYSGSPSLFFLLSLFLLRCSSSGVFIGDFPPPQPMSLLLIITVWELVFCTDSSVRFGSYLPGIMIFMKIGIDLCVLVGLGCRHFNFPSLLCRRTFNSRGGRRRTTHVETASFWSGNDHFQFGP